MTVDARVSYRLTTIADTTNFATFEFSPTGVPLATAPAINDAGQVAFWGATASLDAGIFVGKSDSLAPIANTTGEFSFLGVGPSINNRGSVAFLGGLDSGDAGYFTSDGATITRIADSSGPFNFQRIPTLDNLFGEPVINDSSTVAFRADLDEGGKGILTSTAGDIQTIADFNSKLTTFGIAPDLNERGTVVFSAGTTPVPGAIDVDGQTVPIAELFQNAGIFTGQTDELTTIADPSDGLILFGSSPAINNQGTVAFIAVSTTGEVGVFTGNGGNLTTVADSAGLLSSFRGVDINDAGRVAYLADFDTGGSGIFVGQQEVIATGDELLSSTVVDLNFLNKGFNNRDSVAFWAKLADGRSGVFRADVTGQPKLGLFPKPFYHNIKRYTTTIEAGGDLADIYFPQLPKSQCHATELPIALMLQGALVDKSEYSNFASQVASYGFVVVVPNNERTLTAPNGQSFTGLFPEQEQVHEVLAQMRIEDNNPASPIFKIVDTDKLGLLGHSFGGGAGLGATQEEFCLPGICSGDYTRPPELKAGIFYGTNFRNQQTQEFLPINNDDIPIGLIAGSSDSIAPLSTSQATYDQILNPPKALITVAGANHYGITNEDNLMREPSRPTLDQTTATETIARWSGLFLRASMLGDQRAFDYLFKLGDILDPNVTVMSQTQSILNVA
jgi:dienelactone hydrolase